MTEKLRTVTRIVRGDATADGAGVQLKRIIGGAELDMLDPFLMLDAFGSDKPQDYIGGFPPHPHRGFETVTYMLAGKMRHQDSAGNAGVIEAGGVQWMTAASGIIHSEMPEQEEGLLAGYQLWVNLPASEKMSAPRYQEMPAEAITVEQHDDGLTIRVVAGETRQGNTGVIDNPFVDPLYLVVDAPAGSQLNEQVKEGHNAFIYLSKGKLNVANTARSIQAGELAILSDGNALQLTAEQDSSFIVVSGKPLNEPVAKGGPFVMNTRTEIEQAFADYRSGQLVK